jgi:predicted  nucleic acid-binding Zn-ribbon protein
MKRDYSESVSMICPTCGGSQFLFEQEDSPVRCIGCDRVFASDELIRENGAQIVSCAEDMQAEIIADVTQELRNMLKKFK